MGKAARARARRESAANSAEGAEESTSQMNRAGWSAFGALAVAVVLRLVIALDKKTSRAVTPPVTPPATVISAADRAAPGSLIAAAAKIGFRPTVEDGVGVIENEPVSSAHPPINPDLLAVGSIAPGFRLRTPQGQSFSLAQERGKAVLLEFFATWCPHCDAEAPHLRDLYAALARAGMHVAFLGINADGETAPSVYAYHRYFGLLFPGLLDPSSSPGSWTSQGAAGPVTTAYRVENYPTLYVLDPQGVIVWRGDGEQPDALLRSELVRAAGHP